jgi:hypothetical protein
MSKIIRTDLTELEGEPTTRALVEIEAQSLLGKIAVKLDATAGASSPLHAAITVVLLAGCGCLMAVVLAGRVPDWLAAGCLLLPTAVFALVRLLYQSR